MKATKRTVQKCVAALLLAATVLSFAGCHQQNTVAGSDGTDASPKTSVSESSSLGKEESLQQSPSALPDTSNPMPSSGENTDPSLPSSNTAPTPSPTPTPTPTPSPEPEEKRVSFLAAGDNLIHEAVFTDAAALAKEQSALGGYSGKYYFNSMYNGVADLIKEADLSFVNHECPIAGDEYGISGYPKFNAPEQAGWALKEVGFDIVNVANNHILDMDTKCAGYKNTVKHLEETGMLVIGGYTESDYDDLRIIEKNGIKIAFLSYTQTATNYQTIHSSSPEMIIPKATDAAIKRQTALAKAAADFVVVSIHWGTENSMSVNSEQKRLAKLMNSCGVDVILGHHSHTIQSVEWIKSDAGQTLCYYSLGNLLSTQHPIKNLIGIFASFDLVIKEDGTKAIEHAAAIPHLTWYSTKRDALQIYRFADVTSALVSSHGSQLKTDHNGGTFTLADLKKHVEQQVPAEFLKY